jgi:hypothetical protein
MPGFLFNQYNKKGGAEMKKQLMNYETLLN